MTNDANEMRCIANEIILDLHAKKEQGQIELLLMACMLSHKSLDPGAAHRTWCQNAIDTLDAAAAWEAKQKEREWPYNDPSIECDC
jgi:hypothetical protein